MQKANAQAIIGQLREEIRRREASLPQGGLRALASGFGPLDELLPGGGFPVGRVTELCGSPASGKTTLALMALGRATASGGLVAFVDSCTELYPPAAAALGARLSRLLIVRPKDPSQCVRAASLLARSKAFAAVAVDLAALPSPAGPLSRRLLEAAEIGRCALILLSQAPSGLDASLRLSVERPSERELSLCVERSRLGPPGRSARGRLPNPEGEPEPAPAASPVRLLRGELGG